MAALVLALHAVAGGVWVGGMFFAYMVLRPAALGLEPPARLALWGAVLGRFFAWVWGFVAVLAVSGGLLIELQFAGRLAGLWHVHVMMTLGTVMFLLFGWLVARPYRRLRAALAQGDLPGAALGLAGVRRIVGINLTLGLIVLAAAAGGRLVPLAG
ncbi:CopD family protein [Azospirillum sp. TSO22-1]|uniref:CopD family protein n=1 Tax=Azospirillum sp. TSO22-1 TaxID=716789 RepID=UPI000D6227D6|nr:CopD family protein [Azospirillum sp. TSO22-1]PWC41698.1 hypothetical protein TSO221_23110 [Azospirillum sp. TSO22-1]